MRCALCFDVLRGLMSHPLKHIGCMRLAFLRAKLRCAVRREPWLMSGERRLPLEGVCGGEAEAKLLTWIELIALLT